MHVTPSSLPDNRLQTYRVIERRDKLKITAQEVKRNGAIFKKPYSGAGEMIV